MLNTLFTPSFWIGTFINVFITMMFIWLIKKAFSKVEVPYVSEMVQEV